jgi:hypothetical protein
MEEYKMRLIEKVEELYETGKMAPLKEDKPLSPLQKRIVDNLSFRIKDPTDDSKSYSRDMEEGEESLCGYLKRRILEEIVTYTGIIENNSSIIDINDYLVDAHLVINPKTNDVVAKYYTKSPFNPGTRYSSHDDSKGDHIYIGKDMFNLIDNKRKHRGLQTQEKVITERFLRVRDTLRSITNKKNEMVIDEFINNVQGCLDNLRRSATDFYDVCDTLGFDKKKIKKSDVRTVHWYGRILNAVVGTLSHRVTKDARCFHKTDIAELRGVLSRFGKDVGNMYSFLNKKLMPDIKRMLGYKAPSNNR